MSINSQSSSSSSTESSESDNQLVELFNIEVEMTIPKLSYESGIKFIPRYGGEENELGSFIKSCEYVLNNVVDTIQPLILEGILAKLSGRADQVTRFKTINGFGELKDILTENFGIQQTVSQLQLELAACIQSKNEDVKAYYEKVESICFKLIEAMVLENPKKTEETVINKIVKKQALTVFVAGLKEPYGIIVKSQSKNTLKEAYQVALEEEKSVLAQEHNKKLFTNNDKGAKSSVKCFKCNKIGHKSFQCYSKNTSQGKNQNYGNTNKESDKKKWEEQAKITCNYCKKPGHILANCYKIKNKNKNQGENSNNGNNMPVANSLTVSEYQARVLTIIEMKNECVKCEVPLLKNNVGEFLVDSGADLNLIKLSKLKGDTRMFPSVTVQLKGINATPVLTLGRTILELIVGGVKLSSEFEIVFDDFPIYTDGIIGKKLLKEYKMCIDLERNVLVVPDRKISIPPRAQTVVPIHVNESLQNKCLMIQSQHINNDVIIGSTIGEVETEYMKGIVLNSSDEWQEINILELKNLEYEEYEDCEQILICSNEENRIDLLISALRVDHLNKEERETIYEVCFKYAELFFLEGDKLSTTKSIKHSIPVPDGITPINVKPYRLPRAQKEEIDRQIKDLEANEIIVKCNSAWNAPLVVVPKKEGISGEKKYRVCVDFRKLNEVTVGDVFPLPQITEILDELGKCKYFTTIDLASGYHQIELDERDADKTGFSTGTNH